METALVIPVVFALIFGIIEAGFLAYSHVTVDDVASAGARRAAIAGADEDADAKVLSEIADRVAGVNRATVDRVVIYAADGFSDDPPEECTTGPEQSLLEQRCSSYSADSVFAGDPGECAWCPADRSASDLIGVWIRFEHRSLSGLFDSITLTASTVLPVEPGI